MKVAVLGAGVIGVTTAYALARKGAEVVVFDRQLGPALETSFANGGQLSANHAEPWANPGTPAKVLKWLGRKNAPLKIHWRLDSDLADWALRFALNCQSSRAEQHMQRALRVALHSRACLAELREETGIDYHRQTRGILHLCFDQVELDRQAVLAERFSDLGCRRILLTPDECRDHEPTLEGMARPLTGGVLSADDESGDAHVFTTELAKHAEALGVDFRFKTTIKALQTDGRRLTGVLTDEGVVTADHYVLALGSYSARLLKPLGIKLSLLPAKGYSVSLDVSGQNLAPTAALIDDVNKIVFSRLGPVLRIAGMAELAGFDDSIDQGRANHILNCALGVFPDLAGGTPTFWAGLRPLTPDNVPVIGPSGYDNLTLNTGHGTLGWTMSAGSASMVAGLILDGDAGVDLDGLTVDRFKHY
ncbi:MAG: D-amino acid dehydrogenase [Magnetovibrionaceae bacterium]